MRGGKSGVGRVTRVAVTRPRANQRARLARAPAVTAHGGPLSIFKFSPGLPRPQLCPPSNSRQPPSCSGPGPSSTPPNAGWRPSPASPPPLLNRSAISSSSSPQPPLCSTWEASPSRSTTTSSKSCSPTTCR